MTKELEAGKESINWRDTGGYMTPEHPDAFVDLPEMPNPYKSGPAQKCLRCHGYGQWNLILNEYSRKEGYNKHFRSFCSNCSGYGWTRPEDHIHKWKFDRQISNCYTQYKCSLCSKIQKVDSSD